MHTSSRKAPVKRQETFGPDSPIHEWELERANLLRERREYAERIEKLENQMENDRVTYEKNAASLLREIKTKESSLKKHLEETEERLMSQVFELQEKLKQKTVDHESEMHDLEEQHEQSLQSEQKKYERRIKALHERLASQRERGLSQEPISPHSDDTGAAGTVGANSNEVYQEKAWQTPRWAAEPAKHIQGLGSIPEEQFQTKLKEESSPDMRLLRDDSGEQPNTVKESAPVAIPRKNPEYDLIELGLQRRIAQLEQRIAEQGGKHHEIVTRIKESQDAELQRLRDLFVDESRDASMHNEAQIQNLQVEHRQVISELREQYENELNVQIIEHKSQMDVFQRELEKEHNDLVAKLQQEWQAERRDLQASMSNVATDTQTYWENKIQVVQTNGQCQLKRLRDEMEVVKSRLGNEIERRHKVQEQMAQWQEKHGDLPSTEELVELQKQYSALQRRLDKLIRDHREARKVAKDIVSLVTHDSRQDKTCLRQPHLVDLLQYALRRVTIAFARQHPVHLQDSNGVREAYSAMLEAL